MKLQMTPAAIAALAKGDEANFFAAAMPGGIERQEKAGQIDQSFQETLPIKGTEPGKGREQFEALGFVFSEPTEGIFVKAKFPKGWRKQVTDHAMWSKLMDDKGRERGSIFYKAAFYDRSAHVSLVPRYALSPYEPTGVKGQYQTAVTDARTVINTFGIRKEDDYAAADAHRALAEKWLNEKFPDWRNPAAYWS